MVREVVRPVLEELKPVIADRRIRIEDRLPSSVNLKGDRSLLKIVCKNLLDNALKYGRIGGRIGIDFSEKEGELRFEISNEGQGQPAERLPHLFEKFVRFGSQVDGSRGTGLGLFITRDIVQKHGGRIWAESQEGEWMKFVFTLKAQGKDGGSVEQSADLMARNA
jgi:signal transduction histidine kinase